MLTVIAAHNPLDRSTWQRFDDVESLPDFLLTEMAPLYGGKFPDTGKLYLETVDDDHDITPRTPLQAEALSKIEGTVYFVVWPAGPAILAQIAITAVLALVSYTISHIQKPDEKVTQRRIPQGSPNNFPGDRQNQARILERIPDIYGRVKATPDLLQFPYIRYENNLQIETTYMCVGHGTFDVLAADVKEGDTPVSGIEGSSIAIYPPGEVPGSLGTPQLTIGPTITDTLYNVVPVKEVKGEVLQAPNYKVIVGDVNTNPNNPSLSVAPLFSYPSTGVGQIDYSIGWVLDEVASITGLIAVGDNFGLDWVTQEVRVNHETSVEGTGGIANRPNLSLLPDTPDDDHYTITAINTAVAGHIIVTFTVPVSKQTEWARIAIYNPTGGGGDAPAGTCYNRASILYVLDYRQGPFFVNDPGMKEVHFSIVAPQGLWADDGKNQAARLVKFAIELTPCNSAGVATGPKELYQPYSIQGTKFRRDLIGVTYRITPTFTGRFLFSAYRQTLTPFREFLRSYAGDSEGGQNNRTLGGAAPLFGTGIDWYKYADQHVDEIQLTHAYSMSVPRYPRSSLDLFDLGNVTTVHCKRVQRKVDRGQEPEKRLNMIVTRQVNLFDSTSDTFVGVFGSLRGMDALFDVLRSPTLGNLPDSQIDLAGIADAFNAVTDAFQDAQASSFSHTFDSKDTSLEDMLAAISESCFVTLYRQGNIIKALPDISTQNAALLFNHRNKIPRTETRTVTFATEEDFDGVEVEYTDDTVDRIQLYTIPATGIPRNPQKIRVAGVRTRDKAAMHAWRAYNRLLYQNTVVEFDATEEASLGLVNERILVADNTRPDTMDGEIIAVNGLDLYTSQEVIVIGTNTLFLQGFEGATAAVAVTQGPTRRSLTLGTSLPAGILYIDDEGNTNTKYMLCRNSDTSTKAFRMLEKSNKELGVYNVKAYNYTEGYYFYDGILVYVPFKPFSGYPAVSSFDDRSPYEWVMTRVVGTGTSGITNDPIRGRVYIETIVGNTFNAEDNSGLALNFSYTIACWLYNEGTSFTIAQSNSSNAVVFVVSVTTLQLIAFHDGVQYITGPFTPSGEWYHVALTYDHTTLTQAIYLNGGAASTTVLGTVPGHASFTGWRMFSNLVGRADSLRIYKTAKPLDFIRELYQKELLS